MQPRFEIFRLNTDLLPDCLEGLSEEEFWRQTTPATNTAGFLVAHLIDAGNHRARTLGHPCGNRGWRQQHEVRGLPGKIME